MRSDNVGETALDQFLSLRKTEKEMSMRSAYLTQNGCNSVKVRGTKWEKQYKIGVPSRKGGKLFKIGVSGRKWGKLYKIGVPSRNWRKQHGVCA